MNMLQSNRLLKIQNLESLVGLEQLYLSDNGIEVIEGLDTLVGNCQPLFGVSVDFFNTFSILPHHRHAHKADQ